jgi:hypothetical protein
MNYASIVRTVVRCLVTVGIILTLLLGAGAPSDFTGRVPVTSSQVAP